jgi:hypothetical protein
MASVMAWEDWITDEVVERLADEIEREWEAQQLADEIERITNRLKWISWSEGGMQ